VVGYIPNVKTTWIFNVIKAAKIIKNVLTTGMGHKISPVGVSIVKNM